MKQKHCRTRWLRLLSLFIAFIALAVPKAQAWTFDENFKFYVQGEGYEGASWDGNEMTWDSANSWYYFDAKANSSTIKFKFKWSDRNYAAPSAKPDMATPTGSLTWSGQFWASNSNTNREYNNLTSGNTYRIFIKNESGNPSYAILDLGDLNGSTWVLHGQMINSNWGDKTLDRVGTSNEFTAEFKPVTAEGSFGLKQMVSNTQNAWYAPKSSTTFGEGSGKVTSANFQTAAEGNTNPSFNFDTSKTYVVTFNTATRVLTIEPKADTRTLTSLKLYKNGTEVADGSLLNNTTVSVSGIQQDDYFYVVAGYDDNSTEYYYANATISGNNSSQALTQHTSAGQTWKAGDILSADFKVTNNTPTSIAVSNVVVNTVTDIKLDGVSMTKSGTTFSKTDISNETIADHTLQVFTSRTPSGTYYTISGTGPFAAGQYNLTEGTASSKFRFSDDIVTATLSIATSGASVGNATITRTAENSWTFTPAAGADPQTSGTIVVKKVDSHNRTVYYTHAAITDYNTYALTEVSSEQPITVNISGDWSAKVTWSDGVPTLKVIDPNAKILYVGSNTNDDWKAVEMNKKANGDFTYDLNVTSGSVYFLISEGKDDDTNQIVWGDSWRPHDNSNYLVNTNATITADGSNDKSFYINEPGTYTITVKPSDIDSKKFSVSGFSDIYLSVAKNTGSSYEDFRINKSNEFPNAQCDIYLGEYTLDKDTGDIYLGVKGGSTYYGHKEYEFHSGHSASLPLTANEVRKIKIARKTMDESNTQKYYIAVAVDSEGIPFEIYVSYNSKPTSWTPDVPRPELCFETREERANNGFAPTVFVKADYLNNNRIAPDWEMDTEDGRVFTLENVTLRGNNGSNASSKLTFVVATKSGDDVTLTPYEYTPSASLLESGNSQFGRSFDLKFTWKDGENNEVNIIEITPKKLVNGNQDKSIPFISLVGYRYQQKKNEYTPNNHSAQGGAEFYTGRGWQESWVVYNGSSPLRDNIEGSKELFYSTQWPPKTPIQFAAVKEFESDSDNKTPKKVFELSSNNIVFQPYEEEDGKVIKTGAQWKAADVLQDEAHYNLRITSDLKQNQKYMRYVINNGWVLGSTKVWTGWGSQLYQDDKGRSGAQWANHKNWGYGNNKATDNDGTKISSQTPYTMGDTNGSDGNFKFDSPTYFKTIELYVPVTDENGTPSSSEMPIFYTTIGKGDPSIQAKSDKVPETNPRTNNTGSVAPMFDGTYFEENGNAPVSFRVNRYKGANSSGAPSTWSYEAEVDITQDGKTVAQWLDAMKTNYTNASANQDPTNWFIEREALENGLYFYGLQLFDCPLDQLHFDAKGQLIEADKDHLIDQVASNTISIASVDMQPSVRALQLLELTKEGFGKLGVEEKSKGTWKWADADKDLVDKPNRYFVTYQPSGTGDYFAVSESENKVIPVDAKKAQQVINDKQVIWTTQYFVRAGNISEYMSNLDDAIAGNWLEKTNGYDENPAYEIEYTYSDNTASVKTARAKYDPDNKLGDDGYNATMARSGNGTIGLISTLTEGQLTGFEFTSNLHYYYTPKDAATVTVHSDNTAAVTPAVPGAYNLRYSYVSEREEIPTVSTAKLPTTSSVLSKKAGNHELTLTDGSGDVAAGVPADIDDACEKLVSVPNKTHRHLNCVFEFDRPNVSKAILDNYDIYYDLLVDNNDPDVKLLRDVIEKDDASGDLNQKGPKSYKVTVADVSPLDTTYPVFAVKGTVYVHKDELLEDAGPKIEDRRAKLESGTYSDYKMYHSDEYRTLTLPVQGGNYTGNMLYVKGINTTGYSAMDPSISSEGSDGLKLGVYYDSLDGMKYAHYYVTPQSYDFGGNGDLFYDDGDEATNVGYESACYYDVEAYIPGKIGKSSNQSNPLHYDEETGIWDGSNYTTSTELMSVVNTDDGEGNISGTIQVPESGMLFVARYFDVPKTSADYPIVVFTPVYIFKRLPAASTERPEPGDEEFIHLKYVAENTTVESPSSAPRRVNTLEDPENLNAIPGTTADVDGTKYVVMRGAAGKVNAATNVNSSWTNVDVLEVNGAKVTVLDGCICIDLARDARIYSVAGYQVGEGNGRHYVAPGVYLIAVDGKTTKVTVK